MPKRFRAGAADRVAGAVLALGILVLLPSQTACGRARTTSGTDSLLLVTIDTLRADHVSCYGTARVSTPNLDALARRGALVKRAWATVPLTTASHASILTGLYPPGNGVRDNSRFSLPDDVKTLAERLQEAGRRTGAFVASYTVSRLFGLGQGFETYEDDMGHEPDGSPKQQRRGDEVVRHASAWLAQHANAPYFLWVHLYDPHSPYDPPPEYARRHPGDAYIGEVAFADAQLGVLLQALQDSGAAARTVIAVLSDHGEGRGDHGEADHGYLLYETTVHVPFLLVAPGRIDPGTVIDGPASTVDLVPTVVTLLGLPAASDLQGKDLLATPPQDLRTRPIYAETLYPHDEFGWSALYALRKGDLKVVESSDPELYDLATDPAETRDLADSQRPILSSMAAELRTVAAGLVDEDRLARAAGMAQGLDDEAREALESLGYVSGGGGRAPGESPALPSVGGRNPRDAMGILETMDLAQEKLFHGDAAGAIPLLTEVLRIDPRNPQAALKLARAFDKSGREADAQSAYERLVSDHPTFHLGYRSLSDFLEQHGKPLESRSLWLRAPPVLKGLVGLEVEVAEAENAAGMAKEAAARLERYVGSRPEDAKGWAQLGRARASLGDPEGALEAYRRALAVHPTERTAVEGAVNVLVSGNRRPEAVDLVKGLLARSPEDPLLLIASRWLAGDLPARDRARPVHTFSIVARDPKTGEMGVAVQSHYFSVGPVVAWAEAGVGAVATQSLVDVSYGPKGLELMRQGKTASDALPDLLAKDAQRDVRQVAMVDARGNVAAWTGPRCIEAAGGETGEGFSVQANLMQSESVWPAMARAYRNGKGDLAERLLAALEAGQKAGGDVRGQQSAAILVVKGTSSGEPWKDRTFDLRVEDHPRPIEELRRLVRLKRAYLLEDQGDEAIAQNKMDAALLFYSEAARLAPEIPELVFWQAVGLFSAGREAEAMPLFKTVFESDGRWAQLVPRLVKPQLLKADEAGLARIAALASRAAAPPAKAAPPRARSGKPAPPKPRTPVKTP